MRTKIHYWLRPLFFVCCIAIILAGTSQSLPIAQGASPLTLPAGFIDEQFVGGLHSPRAFVFTPDGRILIATRGSATSDDINYGSIRVFKNGVLLPTPAFTFDICGDGERGLLGLALDPDFDTNGYVYAYYTRPAPTDPWCGLNRGAAGPRNRVSRVTMSGWPSRSQSARPE